MSNEPTYRVAGTNIPGGKFLYAQILPNGSSTPTLGENSGKIIESVIWSATGLIIATISDKYLAGGVFPHLQLAIPSNTRVSVVGFTPSTTRLLTLSIYTGGAPADLPADPGNIIHLDFRMRDSGAQ